MQIINYLIYICCGIFTFLGIYLLIDSFVNPDIESFGNSLLKERVKYCNSILFFGGLGYVYFIIKNKEDYNINKSKKYYLILFSCLIFILNSIFLILYPEEFRRGS